MVLESSNHRMSVVEEMLMRIQKIVLVFGIAVAASGCVATGQGLTQGDADAFVSKTIHQGEKPAKGGTLN